MCSAISVFPYLCHSFMVYIPNESMQTALVQNLPNVFPISSQTQMAGSGG